MRYLPVLMIGALLAGCASAPKQPPATPRAAPKATDDQVVRGVGNLRKLVALPVVVEQGSCDWPDVARDLDESAIRFLRDWKGYELVRPAQGDDAAWTLAQELGAWQEKNADAGRPPAELRAKVLVAGENAGADGVLVIHASPECPGGANAGLLTLPARLAGSLNRTLSAGIYETERGTLLWQQHVRPPGWDATRYGAQQPPRFETRQAGEALFSPIENAAPAVLRGPPKPRKATPPAAPEVVVTPAREPTALSPTVLTPPAGTPSADAAPPRSAGAPPAPESAASTPAPEPVAASTPSQPAAATPAVSATVPGATAPSAATAMPVEGAAPALPAPVGSGEPAAPARPEPPAAATTPLAAPATAPTRSPAALPPPEPTGAPPAAAPPPLTPPDAAPRAPIAIPAPAAEPIPALPPPESPASPRLPDTPAMPATPEPPADEPPAPRPPIRT
jgi:hypothetical protein